MGRDPGELSIAELRARFGQGSEPASSSLLSRLQADPRLGARRLGDELARRQQRARNEWRRVEALLELEHALWQAGVAQVAGVDEVGIGPLAGPVVAAAVVFPPGTHLDGIDDSKRLTPRRRRALCDSIRAVAAGVGIGLAEVEEVDRLNVYQAGLLAMRRAVEELPQRPQHLLVDARVIPEVTVPQSAIRKGDSLSFSIAGASIVAKCHRDRLMEQLDARYPVYGFARHKGYGTGAHQEAIRRHGLCELHRRSFPVLAELARASPRPAGGGPLPSRL